MRFRKRMALPLALALGALAAMMFASVANATHARPKAASPLVASMVLAYNVCGAPNRTHGPPLAFASCNPPAQTSAQATVGTPDAFGGGANSASHLRLRAIVDPLCCENNDILINVALNDLRCVPTDHDEVLRRAVLSVADRVRASAER